MCYTQEYCAQVVSSAQLFQDYHIPLLYAYSSTDEFVSSEIHTEFAQNFGASSDLTETYSSDHKLIEKCSEIGSLSVLQIWKLLVVMYVFYPSSVL